MNPESPKQNPGVISERAIEIEALVGGAQSLEELAAVVEKIDIPVEGSQQTYDPLEVANQIRLVEKIDYNPNFITNAFGIRERAIKLKARKSGTEFGTEVTH